MGRAMLRAAKMVDREWMKVWETVSKARQEKQRGERINKRVERMVERRKRMAQEENCEVGTQATDSEQEGVCGVTRQKLRG